MIKFRAEGRDGKAIIGLGLSFANLAQLQQQKSILVDGLEIGLNGDVMIFAGETEEAILADLRERGVNVDDG